MYRNLMNRWWTAALAVVVGLVSLVFLPVRSHAGTTNSGAGSMDPGTPPDPGTSGAGDPDAPTNTGRPTRLAGSRTQFGSMQQAPVVPNATRVSRNTWVFRLRVALQGVRVFYLRD